eukprot:m.163421 g.163421  ORF g.163421 m.163421 type:complete len:294 (-) comp24915_c0_seq3:1912-2793(-)
MITPTIFFTLLGVVSAQFPVGNGSADPRAIVDFADLRFTFLTPRIIRIQNMTRSTPSHELPSMTVINRRTPVPDFTVSNSSHDQLIVTMGNITLTFNPNQAPSCQCSGHNQTDAVKAVRTSKYPNGVVANTTQECCMRCQFDPECHTFVFASKDHKGPANCWPLKNLTSSRPRDGHFLGQATTACANLKVTLWNGNATSTWTPNTPDTGNLGGTISSWNEVKPQQLVLQNGILSRDGWAVLDDSNTPRFDKSKGQFANYPWINLDPLSSRNNLDVRIFQTFTCLPVDKISTAA